MRLDLHIHTDASDGAWSPEEVVAAAVAGTLDVVAITDHDTAAAVREARAAAEDTPLLVIAGAELSSTHEGRDVHILGYGLDPASSAIRNHGRRARAQRMERMDGMVARLREQGIGVEMEDVLAAAGPDEPMIGRPHLARALVDRGVVASVEEAFDTLIADQHRAFIPTALGPPEDAVATVLAAGGIPVWAHPPMDQLDTLLPALRDAGLQGLEAYRPGWNRNRTRKVVARAREGGLCVTGGSDWHGPDRNGRLGDFWVPGDQVGGFLDLLRENGEEVPEAR